MKKWKHINFEQRKTIASGIAHKMKLKDIAELLYLEKLRETELLLNQLNLTITFVLLSKDGLMFVPIVKKDIKIVLLISIIIMLDLHKNMLTIILNLLEEV